MAAVEQKLLYYMVEDIEIIAVLELQLRKCCETYQTLLKLIHQIAIVEQDYIIIKDT